MRLIPKYWDWTSWALMGCFALLGLLAALAVVDWATCAEYHTEVVTGPYTAWTSTGTAVYLNGPHSESTCIRRK